jgi:hypothetical protein
MAIKINNDVVIDNNKKFYGDGSNLTNISGSGDFDTSITSTTQFNPLSYETTLFSFPSTADRKYIIHSINASNVSNEEINLILKHRFTASSRDTHLAYNVPIVAGGSVELLKQPHIANPNDVILGWTNDITYSGKSNAVEIYVTYTTSTVTNYFGVGVSTASIPTTDLTTVYTSTTNPSVIESIHLTNRTDDGDYPVSVQVTNGASVSFLVKDMIIPRYATVEICDMPKRVEANGVIKVGLGQTNTIDVSISGKTITG